MEKLYWITDVTFEEMCELLGVDPEELHEGEDEV